MADLPQRGAPLLNLDVPASDDPRYGLFPRPIDDWTEAPRGLILATVDIDRAIEDLAPALMGTWVDVGEDDVMGARCRRLTLGRSVLVLPTYVDMTAADVRRVCGSLAGCLGYA